MSALSRVLSVTVACGFVLAAQAAEKSTTKTSPFVPAPTPATAPTTTAPENYELAAISTIGTKTTVSIYDKAAKKGRWIRVGESSDGIQVLRFDPRREQVVVRIQNGPEKTLSLRTSTSTPVVTTSSLSAVSPPIPLPPVKPESEPAVLADAPPPTPASATPPPAPGTPAYQEHEARMLVSDLLEIGMAQRKAYEDAQRKAAESAANATPVKSAPPANATPSAKASSRP